MLTIQFHLRYAAFKKNDNVVIRRFHEFWIYEFCRGLVTLYILMYCKCK